MGPLVPLRNGAALGLQQQWISMEKFLRVPTNLSNQTKTLGDGSGGEHPQVCGLLGPVSLLGLESHWGVCATSLPISTDITVQIQTTISHTSF